MNVAIYSRVSTERQSHDSQVTELREYCRRRSWEFVSEYRDVISGSRFARKGLEALMKDIRRGRIKTVVCFKLDRLGRSLAHLAQIISEFTSHDVALICTSQGIDTSENNPAGRLQLGVLMAVAEFERSIIQERVNAGLRAAREKGKRLGRPTTLSQHKASVQALRSQGKSLRVISRELNIPLSSVQKLAK